MRRVTIIWVVLFLDGCAALLNSNRPRYDGPVVRPAWHNASVKVEQTPLILDGRVFAIARPFSKPDWPRVFAFDLRTGNPLWVTTFPAKAIVVSAGSSLYVADDGDHVHTLNVKTGGEAAEAALSFSKATSAEGVLYAISGSSVEARPLGTERTTPLWQALTRLTSPDAPVFAAGTVYVFGSSRSDILAGKSGLTAVYALDAKTGAVRWKWEVEDKTDSFICDNLAADGASVYVWILDKRQSIVGRGVLIAFDSATGKEKWRHAASMYANLAGQPLLLNPNVVLIADYPPGREGTADETGFLYRALDRTTGAKVWESQTNWKYRDSVAFRGLLFVSDHKVHEVLDENNDTTPDSWVSAVNLKTGKELWRSETVELGVFTTPAAGEGMVVVGSKPFTWSDPSVKPGKNEVAGLWAWPVSQ